MLDRPEYIGRPMRIDRPTRLTHARKSQPRGAMEVVLVCFREHKREVKFCVAADEKNNWRRLYSTCSMM